MAEEFKPPTPSRGAPRGKVASRTPLAEADINPAIARDPGVKADPQDFGAGVGAAATGLGDVGTRAATGTGEQMALVQRRIQANKDMVNRSRWETDYNGFIVESVDAFTKTDDITSPASRTALGESFSSREQEILAKHKAEGATDDSVARLAVKLGSMRGEASTKAAILAQAESVKRTESLMEKDLSKVIDMASVNPGELPTILEYARSVVADRADGLTPTQQEAWNLKYSTAAISTIVDTYRSAGKLDEAAKLLADPEIAKNVDPTTLRVMKINQVVAQTTAQKEAQKNKISMVTASADLQVKYSQVQTEIARMQKEQAETKAIGAGEQHKIKLADLAATENELKRQLQQAKDAGESATAVAKLNAEQEKLKAERARLEKEQAETATKDAAKAADFQKRMNELTEVGLKIREEAVKLAEKQDPALTQSNAADVLRRLAPGYGAGVLSDDQDRKFRAALATYRKETRDPATGGTVRSDLTPDIMDALRARGDIDEQGRIRSETDQPRPAISPALRGAAGAPGGSQSTSNATLWDLRGKVTGPIPLGAAILQRAPGLSKLVGSDFGRQALTAQTTYTTILDSFIGEMKRTNYEAEYRRLADKFNIDPKVWDTEDALGQSQMGVDDALMTLSKLIGQRIGTLTSDVAQRQAIDAVSAIAAFREALGVPPRIKTKEDWATLKPGQKYFDPDMVLRTR